MACNRESHPLNTCSKFQGMWWKEKWALVNSSECCRNCLKVGHMASKSHVHPACRMCCKTHHTLLHIDISKPPEEPTTENLSTVTHVPHQIKAKRSIWSPIKQRLLGPDGNTTQARVFLDPGVACYVITQLQRSWEHDIVAPCFFHQHGELSWWVAPTALHVCAKCGSRNSLSNFFCR